MLENIHDSDVFFLHATPYGTGAVGVFHCYGNERILTEKVDAHVRTDTKIKFSKHLNLNELRYGKLYDEHDLLLDEVMLAKPKPGMRVVMCHGGIYICQRIVSSFKNMGLRDIMAVLESESCQNIVKKDYLFDMLLSGCVTDTQAGMVLAAREGRENGEGLGKNFEKVLLTHSLCLVGPPNVGKSSLLNRLSGFDRAFVHAEAGATRDVVGELVELAGYAVLVEDLPGYTRDRTGLADAAWVKASQKLKQAEVVALVCDASREWDEEIDEAAREIASIILSPDSEQKTKPKPKVMIVLNKSDLPQKLNSGSWLDYFPNATTVSMSSLEGGDAAEKFSRAFYEVLA